MSRTSEEATATPAASLMSPKGLLSEAQHLATQRFASLEIATGLRARFVDRAKMRALIERHASAVATLIHAANSLV
jgi:hypothetical protein